MRRMILSVVTACCLSGWLCLPLSAQGEGGVIVPWDAARDAPVKGGRFYLLATDARELPAGLRQRLLTEDPEKVLKAMEIIASDPNVKAIFFNIFGGITRCDDVANGLVEAFRQMEIKVPIVIRLTGTNEELAREILEQSGLPLVTVKTMAEGAKKAIELAGA